MTAMPAPGREPAGAQAAAEWAQIEAMAPQIAATMCRYLSQLATFLGPASVGAADNALRQLARWALGSTGIEAVADIHRDDVEGHCCVAPSLCAPGMITRMPRWSYG